MANTERRPYVVGKQKQIGPPIVIWKGHDYPRIESGLREVRTHHIQGPEWVRSFRRWSLRIECHILDEPGIVSAFFNFGNDPTSPSMGKGRQSRFYKLWVLATGEPPKRGEQIDFNALLQKCFLVRIEDSSQDSRGQAKPEGEVYSRITEFVAVAGPTASNFAHTLTKA